jgi:hypothetical protein
MSKNTSYEIIGAGAQVTKDVIKIMDEEGVKRLISSNILGIYDEVPGAFGDYNRDFCFNGKVEKDNPAVVSDDAIEKSDLATCSRPRSLKLEIISPQISIFSTGAIR